MANDQITYRKIIFTIDAEITHCEVWFDTTNVVLTGRYRKKSFPPSKSLIDILTEEFGKNDVLLWP